jgi:hypothetical protein
MLVRALAEYYRSLHNGRFPRSWTRDPAKQWSPFERLVGHVLRGCGVSGISPLDLVRRYRVWRRLRARVREAHRCL